ncbi:hypothetical protein DMB95_00915 [Campylobacter sp. MIT 12-8780]|uniref:hypothetical protein n=1 Tax=unclassified Campylobacter TaxID=2593542 RepID=UPI00115CF01B|nr:MULTISPECIES: hypothetical protein [unclassified Campylobacter]NDJ26521.1 hypothetical protein [Campylobacter sp. MIT 19-121]TQR43093.1 hypothetical protein DMB95_00915 [Campylobacter sp. MIT 12-8780]
MTYSFIKPKIKPIFSLFAKIWIAFFVLSIAIIFAVYFFIVARYLLLSSELESKRQEAVLLQEKTSQNDALFDLLTQRKELALQIVASSNSDESISQDGSNIKIKKVVHNLFDLVLKSGGIRLESMQLNKNTLELRGVTPTKEMFSLLVQTPLKSIFDESKTSFYPLNTGWFKFVSTNKSLNYGSIQ